MQSRLILTRFPTTVFAIVFVIAAALCLGTVLGYTLRPATMAFEAPRVIVVHDPGPATASPVSCIWLDHQKAC
jgi:hypothetical protein